MLTLPAARMITIAATTERRLDPRPDGHVH